MRAAARLTFPVLLVIAVAWISRRPWDDYVASVATLAVLLSAARFFYSIRRRTLRAAEMIDLRKSRRAELFAGTILVAIALAMNWVCAKTLVPFPVGMSWSGSVLSFYIDTAAGMVALQYVSIVLGYFGLAALVRFVDLSTDHAAR